MKCASIPGHVKIGFGRFDPQSRLRELRRCYADAELIAYSAPPFPHGYRVEQLVHAELAGFRRKEYCRVCGVEHTEWFKILSAKAKKAVERWAKWIASGPYDRATGVLCQPWQEKLHPRGQKGHWREILLYEPGIDGSDTTQASWQT